MSSSPPTGGTEQDKLRRIAKAALAVFTRQGFHKATMQDIAEEAGVGKGTTYLYFSSKEQLLERIVGEALRQHTGRICAAAESPGSVTTKLRNLFVTTLTTAMLSGELFQFVMQGASGLSEDLKHRLVEAQGQAQEGIAAIIRGGVERGEIRSVDPLLTAHVMGGCMLSVGTALLWNNQGLPGKDLPPAERAEMLAEGLLGVLDLETR